MVSPAAAASVRSEVRTAPWVARSSMSGWPARDSLWIFARRYQEERCQNRLAAASASPCVASRPSLVACQGAAAASSGKSACEVGAVERLGDRPDRLGPEAQRLALVRGEPVRVPGAGEERQDRDVLPELAQAGDEPAARERNVVRVGGNEHMGHGRPSIAGRDRLPEGPFTLPASTPLECQVEW